MSRRFALVLVGGLVLASPAAAQRPTDAKERSQVLTRVVDCRNLTEAEARLACYDREVAAMEAAETRQDLVVVDRDQLRKTRRTLFGLTLPNLSVFGDDNEDDGAQRIETTIKSVSRNPYGKWILTLADGARWAQIDGVDLAVDPRPGHPVQIRRAAMGSYLANVREQTAIRVRRVQ